MVEAGVHTEIPGAHLGIRIGSGCALRRGEHPDNRRIPDFSQTLCGCDMYGL